MAEPSETPPENINTNSNFITIQPTTKLGGRGTPRRKTRRPNNNNYSALIAARNLENKLKPFRTQFQLQDQQELCDITILYDDGRIDIQKQVHVHSTYPMTIHEIDSSETGTHTYHINDLDSTSCEYLFGNIDNLQNEFNNKQIIPLTKPMYSTNYYNDLQQCQVYSQPSRYYMNYVSYQQNPYTLNSYDNYSNSIRQIYGGANTQSNDENDDEDQLISKTSKRKRRRRKHAKPTSEQISSIIPQQEEKDEVTIKEPIEHIENDNINSTKTKRKRRRIRKSKNSLRSSSITSEPEINLLSSLIDEKRNEDILLSSLTPTQNSEFMEKQQLMSAKNDVHANRNVSTKDVMNVIKNDEKKKNDEEKKEIQPRKISARTAYITTDGIIPNILTHFPTVVADVDETEDENEKITLPTINNSSIIAISIENIPSVITSNKILDQQLNTQQQLLSDHIQVNISYFFVLRENLSLFVNMIKDYS
jgi:hypothetical protein